MWLLFMLFSFVLATPAQAILITLEPDNYAVGTNVTNLFEGVTLQRFTSIPGGPISTTPVFIEDASTTDFMRTTASTGAHTFGLYRDPPFAANCWSRGSSCHEGFSALMVQFQQPTNYFEVSASYWFDPLVVTAVGQDGSITNHSCPNCTYHTGGPGQRGNTVTLAIGDLSGVPMFHTLFIGDNLGSGANIDVIRYGSVPEPPSFLLLMLGLTVLLLSRGLRWAH